MQLDKTPTMVTLFHAFMVAFASFPVNLIEGFTLSQGSWRIPPSTSTSTSSSLFANAKQICEFEAGDFPLPTGEWAYDEADLRRLDESDDNRFYDVPRFVTHIDDAAIEALTNFYRQEMTNLVAMKKRKSKKNGGGGGNDDAKIDVLDLCSSWISHLPDGIPYGRVVGIGMNRDELAANTQLTEFRVQDLNQNPYLRSEESSSSSSSSSSSLSFDDSSFDVVCNVVSVDYLTKPREIFQETHRLLRPGGMALISFSNRCFPTKAVSMWLQADDIGRMSIVGSYFHYTAKWKSIEALNLKPPIRDIPERPSFQDMFQNPAKGFAWMNTAAAVQKANSGDPMFAVKAVKDDDDEEETS